MPQHLEEKLHFLREPAADDRVVLVEAERQRLAIEDLLVHPGLDEALQLLRGWLGAALRDPREPDLTEVVCRELDAAVRFGRAAPRAHLVVAAEQHQPGEQELEQRLAQQPPDHDAQPRSGAQRGAAPNGFSCATAVIIS